MMTRISGIVSAYGEPGLLEWRSSDWVTPESALEWFQRAGVYGYNEFTPDLLLILNKLLGPLEVQPAREGSVAVYLRILHDRDILIDFLDYVRRLVRADEIGFKSGTIRVWWD